MDLAARMLILILVTGPLWLTGLVAADAVKSYDQVVDLGVQKYTYITESPRIDKTGNLVEHKPTAGNYQVKAILDPSLYGHTLGFSLHKIGDSTNLLPASLGVPSVSLELPNASGHVVGFLSDGGITPFYFAPETGKITWLKSLPGVVGGTEVFGINASDQIVGAQGGKAIFYSSPISEPVELSSLLKTNTGWQFMGATDINDRGEIIGYGDNPSRNFADFKLEPFASPVPEPTALILFTLLTLIIPIRSRLRKY